MADQVDSLSDAELRTRLAENGFPVMPITDSTRPLLIQKLKAVLKNRNKSKDSGDNRRSCDETVTVKTDTQRKTKGRSRVSETLPQASSKKPQAAIRNKTIPSKEPTAEKNSKVTKDSTDDVDSIATRSFTDDKNSDETDNKKTSDEIDKEKEHLSETEGKSPKSPPEDEEIEYMEWE